MEGETFVNFSVRLTASEREALGRLAARLERRPGDAVRFVIRREAERQNCQAESTRGARKARKAQGADNGQGA